MTRPSAQAAAKVTWALGKLNHGAVPGPVILQWLPADCGLPRQAPNGELASAKNLSKTLLACAMLCFEVKGHVITALVNALLGFNSTQASLLQCCLELACF